MAAPLGFKTFTTGDVLTAADTNGYLMQGVWTFADAAARDAAVTSPEEGNMCYLKDTDALQSYSGTAWVAVGGAGYVGCAVFADNVSTALVANVSQILNFTSESFDTDSFHSNVTNTSRITIPSGKTGKYQIDVYYRLGIGVGYAIANVLKNGSGINDGIQSGAAARASNLGSNSFAISNTMTIALTAGDYVEMGVQTDVTTTTGVYARFSATFLGA